MLAWRTFPDDAGADPGAYLSVPPLEQFGIHAAFTTRHVRSMSFSFNVYVFIYSSSSSAGRP